MSKLPLLDSVESLSKDPNDPVKPGNLSIDKDLVIETGPADRGSSFDFFGVVGVVEPLNMPLSLLDLFGWTSVFRGGSLLALALFAGAGTGGAGATAGGDDPLMVMGLRRLGGLLDFGSAGCTGCCLTGSGGGAAFDFDEGIHELRRFVSFFASGDLLLLVTGPPSSATRALVCSTTTLWRTGETFRGVLRPDDGIQLLRRNLLLLLLGGSGGSGGVIGFVVVVTTGLTNWNLSSDVENIDPDLNSSKNEGKLSPPPVFVGSMVVCSGGVGGSSCGLDFPEESARLLLFRPTLIKSTSVAKTSFS